MKAATRAYHGGFTLLELLVALSVFAVLSLLLFEGLRFAGRVWDISVGGAPRTEDIASVQRFLRGRLEQVYPGTVNGRLELVAFRGTSDEISFNAPSLAIGSGGFNRYWLGTIAADGSKALVLKWLPTQADSSAEWESEVLLPHVAGLSISYRSATNADQWVPEWAGSGGVPALVRIDLSFVSGVRAAWPSFAVQPRVNASAACAFDMVAMQCQS